jgi:hypothetical protein
MACFVVIAAISTIVMVATPFRLGGY